ncbi:DnaJ domain-containing protein [Luteolibacter ambystomatis]|uniref:DnaJ domain-containing protein n=1 Tax=Luteolibacter ambystomatis TaxID=2824561 RepID=A0A975G854_9BACT|nr:DnaJ domain-containing protein [Luteolibacter ambystomatis]QUE50844.1 DnaJ domain-containing protein [Luteolibacter ambystomatis]
MDAFEILGIPRTLVISEEMLRAAFREAGKQVHPDAGGDEADFARLQQAFATLTGPSKRLKHWLTLRGEAGDDRGSIAPELMDLFGQVGTVIQRADAIVRKRDEARSALVLAMLEGETQSCREAVEAAISQVDAALAAETAVFPAIESGEVSATQATRHARNLAFLEKWRANLQERFARLL